MPLLVDGHLLHSVPSNIKDFAKSYARLEAATIKLRDIPSKNVDPQRLLYVYQHEFAVVAPSVENIDIVGADDATTCHILVLRHSGSGVTGIAHLDGSGTEKALQSMLSKVKRLSRGAPEGRFEVHIAGGFLDDRGLSIKLSKQILGALMKLTEEVHLLTACLTDLNDTLKDRTHFPVIYGLAFDLKSASLYPATYHDKGPDIEIRAASHFANCPELEDIFDDGCLRIGPYSWDEVVCQCVVSWIDAPDKVLLRNWSTSPDQEPPHFLNNMRRSMGVLRDHPQPHQTLFPDGKPRRYWKQSDGSWTRV